MSYWKRHRIVILAAAIVLLFLTFADLTGDLIAPLCAAELDHESSSPTDDGPRPGHIDDCFCCSGCVESSLPFSLTEALWLTIFLPSQATWTVSGPPSELYRPPRAS